MAPAPKAEAERQPQGPEDMARLYRSMAEAFGWTPAQVGELTLPQLAMYVNDPDKAEKGRIPGAASAVFKGLSKEEAALKIAAINAARRRKAR